MSVLYVLLLLLIMLMGAAKIWLLKRENSFKPARLPCPALPLQPACLCCQVVQFGKVFIEKSILQTVTQKGKPH